MTYTQRNKTPNVKRKHKHTKNRRKFFVATNTKTPPTKDHTQSPHRNHITILPKCSPTLTKPSLTSYDTQIARASHSAPLPSHNGTHLHTTPHHPNQGLVTPDRAQTSRRHTQRRILPKNQSASTHHANTRQKQNDSRGELTQLF